MISEELLCVVLKRNIINTKDCPLRMCGNDVMYWYQKDERVKQEDLINIYELAHKCKIWAFEQGFIISEINYLFTLGYKFPEFRARIWCILDNHKVLKTQDPETPCMYFDEPTYYEVIFKACEWVLQNRSE